MQLREGLFDLQSVCNAISSLYGLPDQSGQFDRKTADRYMNRWQSSPDAWVLSHTVLTKALQMQFDDNFNTFDFCVQSSYIAAQTMRIKIQNGFDSLPSGVSVNSVCTSLVTTYFALDSTNLFNFAAQQSSIGAVRSTVKQMAISLAQIIVQMSSWTDPLCDLITSYASNVDAQSVSEVSPVLLLVGVLDLLPDEVDNSRIRLGQARRESFRKYLAASSASVLNILTSLLQTFDQPKWRQNLQTCLGAFSALYSCTIYWLRADYFTCTALHRSPILESALAVMLGVQGQPLDGHNLNYVALPTGNGMSGTESKLLALVFDLVCSTIECLRLPSDGAVLDRLVELCMCDDAKRMMTMFERGVAEYQPGDEDAICLSIVRVYTELGCKLVLRDFDQHPPQQLGVASSPISELLLQSTSAILVCASHPDHDVFEITNHFWTKLTDALIDNAERPGSKFVPCLPQMQLQLRPYMEQLLSLMARHCMLNADDVSEDCGDATQISQSKLDEFEFRFCEYEQHLHVSCTDILVSLDIVFGYDLLVSTLANTLVSASAPSLSWAESSVALYFLSALGSRCKSDTAASATFASVVTHLMSIPFDWEQVVRGNNRPHLIVLLSTLRLIDHIGPILAINAELVRSVVVFIIHIVQLTCQSTNTQIDSTWLCSRATFTLAQLATDCDHVMVAHLADLIQITSTLLSRLPRISCGASLDLIGALVHLVAFATSEAQPTCTDVASSFVHQMIQIPIQRLTAILDYRQHKCDASSQKVVKNSDSDSCIYLDMLSTVFRSASETRKLSKGLAEQLVQCAITPVWPALSRTMSVYCASDVRVIERSVKVIRFMFRSVGLELTQLLDPLVTQMVAIYTNPSGSQGDGQSKVRPGDHSCILYLGSILVDKFTTNECPADKRKLCIAGLLNMMSALIPTTFTLLSTASEDKEASVDELLHANGDTIEDFFRLNIRFIQRCPSDFISHCAKSNIIDLVLQCGSASLCIFHKSARGSVFTFLLEVVQVAADTSSTLAAEARQRLTTSIDASAWTVINKIIVDGLFRARLGVPDLNDAASLLIGLAAVIGQPTFAAHVDKALTDIVAVDSIRSTSTGLSGAVDEAILANFRHQLTRPTGTDVRSMTKLLADFSRQLR